VTYVGDGNNIVHSWIRLAAKFDFEFVCACPEGFEPDAATMELANAAGAGRVSVSHEPLRPVASSAQGAGTPGARLRVRHARQQRALAGAMCYGNRV